MTFRNMNPHSKSTHRFVLLSLAAATFIVMIYGNSFHGAWHFDDMGNIIENKNVRLQAFNWNGVKQALHTSSADGRSRVHRPLAFLSFALNYSFGGYDVRGYHLVNLIVHLITAVVLFNFIMLLLQTPKLQARYGSEAPLIAFVAAVLWASHPIQVTAVTYIVQRMTSMAAMFSIISLYAFLKGRLIQRAHLKFVCYLISLMAFLAGLASKENVIILPFCVLIMDALIIQQVGNVSTKRLLISSFVVLVFMGILAYVVVVYGNLSIPTSYPNRPYSPVQRLFTEPRVIISYLFWIAVPMRSKLTLIHDVDYSRTIFDPLTTLPAIVCLVGGAIVLVVSARKYPLTAFCVLFFLACHSVEASFLNLGLVYEHRNYLPSMLLFIPPSAWFIKFIKRKELARGLWGGCLAALAIFILSNGYTVYKYNNIFRSGLSLWLDVTLKSPMLSMGHNNLGKALWDMGAYDDAYREFRTAMKLDRWIDYLEKGMVHHNMGLYQTYVARDYQSALGHFKKSVEIMKGNVAAWYQLGRVHLLLRHNAEAESIFAKATDTWPDDLCLMVGMTVTLLDSGKLDSALNYIQRATEMYPQNYKIAIVYALIYKKLNMLDRSQVYIRKYLEHNPESRRNVEQLLETDNGYNHGNSELLLLLELAGVDGILKKSGRPDSSR